VNDLNRNGVIVLAVLATCCATVVLQLRAAYQRSKDDDRAFSQQCEHMGGQLRYAGTNVCIQKGAWFERQP